MNNASRSFAVGFHNLHCIFRRVPAVNIDRQVFSGRQLKLPDKPMFLNLSWFRIPVIVQSDFPDSPDFPMTAHPVKFSKSLLIQFPYMIRMDTH